MQQQPCYLDQHALRQIERWLLRLRVNSSDLISVNAAAQILDITPSAVRQAVKRNRLFYVINHMLNRRDVLDYRERRNLKAERSQRKGKRTTASAGLAATFH